MTGVSVSGIVAVQVATEEQQVETSRIIKNSRGLSSAPEHSHQAKKD